MLLYYRWGENSENFSLCRVSSVIIIWKFVFPNFIKKSDSLKSWIVVEHDKLKHHELIQDLVKSANKCRPLT
jgi:hypothetical protein